MDIVARIDELVRRGFDNGLIAAITGVEQADVSDFRRTRVAPQDPMAGGGGGGGSSFAHLTEDADNTALWGYGAGWGFVASEDEGDWAHTWSGHFGDGTIFTTVLTPDANAIYVGAVDEANQRLIVHGDGSLHWGDGIAAPSLTAQLAGGNDPFSRLRVRHEDQGTHGYAALDIGKGYAAFYGAAGVHDAGFTAVEFWDDEGNGNQPRFAAGIDGSLHWGDGVNPPDTILGDAGGGLWSNNGFWAISDHADLTAPNLYLAPDGQIWSTLSGDHTTSFFHGANKTEAGERIVIDSGGAIHWGDGDAATDTSLQRVGANNLVASAIFASSQGADYANHPYAGLYGDGSLYAEDDSVGSYAGLISDGTVDIHDDSGHYAQIKPTGISSIGTFRAIQLTSPNDTLYNITVTNAGAVIATAA